MNGERSPKRGSEGLSCDMYVFRKAHFPSRHGALRSDSTPLQCTDLVKEREMTPQKETWRTVSEALCLLDPV